MFAFVLTMFVVNIELASKDIDAWNYVIWAQKVLILILIFFIEGIRCGGI